MTRQYGRVVEAWRPVSGDVGCTLNCAEQFVEIHRNSRDSVMPAKAGIQSSVDFLETRSLDPGFRRGDESNFNKLLGLSDANNLAPSPRIAGNSREHTLIPGKRRDS